jgi:chaperonin GroEL (HSP60 family)
MIIDLVGTMVEAALAAVKKNLGQTLMSQGSEKAIADLAEWLLEQAPALNRDVNSKGHLLESGVTITKGKKISGSDRVPMFEAVATLYGKSAPTKGRTKKMTEQPLE